jgi:hypothetical protein
MGLVACIPKEGFLGGLALVYVPYASMGWHTLEEAHVIEPGT